AGNTVIYEDGYGGGQGRDTVEFGDGVTEGALQYQISGNDMVITNQTTSKTLDISGWFDSLTPTYQVGSFQFADGTTLSGQQMDDLVQNPIIADYSSIAGSGNTVHGINGSDYTMRIAGGDSNTIYAGDGNDTLYAGSGSNNTLYGGSGSDIFYTGTGTASLYSGGGNNTYVWGSNSGSDTINERGYGGQGRDTLQFQNLVMASIEFSQNGNDLVCTSTQSGQNITISNWVLGTSNQVDMFKFSDGMLTASDINNKIV
ncbi:MAG: calcium-binding protein, partial [Negativicutes bacterium]|nr:calcium-binding protein [Negativicutes bacterium]